MHSIGAGGVRDTLFTIRIETDCLTCRGSPFRSSECQSTIPFLLTSVVGESLFGLFSLFFGYFCREVNLELLCISRTLLMPSVAAWWVFVIWWLWYRASNVQISVCLVVWNTHSGVFWGMKSIPRDIRIPEIHHTWYACLTIVATDSIWKQLWAFRWEFHTSMAWTKKASEQYRMLLTGYWVRCLLHAKTIKNCLKHRSNNEC